MREEKLRKLAFYISVFCATLVTGMLLSVIVLSKYYHKIITVLNVQDKLNLMSVYVEETFFKVIPVLSICLFVNGISTILWYNFSRNRYEKEFKEIKQENKSVE